MDKVLSSGNSLTHSPEHSQCLGSHIIKNLSVLGSPADWSQRGLVLRHSFVRRMMKIGWVLDSHDPILLWFLKLLLTLKLNIVKIECLIFALLPFARQKTIYLKNYWYWKQNKNVVVGRNCFFMCPSSMQRCQSKRAVRDVLFFYPMHHVVATRPLLFSFAINPIAGWFQKNF